MKYIYKEVIGKLMPRDCGFGQFARRIQNLMFLGMNNLPVEDEDLDLTGNLEWNFGGSFMPCEGTYDEHPLYMTDPFIVQKYKDIAHESKLELAKYFGSEADINNGYIGKWDPEINKHAKIYYILMEDGPHEIFLTKYNDMKFVSNVQSAQYVVNINGNMMDCSPEEGDVLFDDFEEASKYFKDVYIGEMKLKREAEEKEAQRIKDEAENGKPIESLGDGTYIGQQAGYTFYYQGQKFKSPIGIRSSHPINTIIDIKNGKVFHRDWFTKI